jgi:hypothetical protein
MAKQNEVIGCSIRRTSQRHDLGSFGSGNFSSGPFGVVSWCIIEMKAGTLKRLSTLAIAETSFDVRQNRWTKELHIILHPGRQSEKNVDAGRRPNNGNDIFMA